MDGTSSVLSPVADFDIRVVEPDGCMQGKWKIIKWIWNCNDGQ